MNKSIKKIKIDGHWKIVHDDDIKSEEVIDKKLNKIKAVKKDLDSEKGVD